MNFDANRRFRSNFDETLLEAVWTKSPSIRKKNNKSMMEGVKNRDI